MEENKFINRFLGITKESEQHPASHFNRAANFANSDSRRKKQLKSV